MGDRGPPLWAQYSAESASLIPLLLPLPSPLLSAFGALFFLKKGKSETINLITDANGVHPWNATQVGTTLPK